MTADAGPFLGETGVLDRKRTKPATIASVETMP
jgi:hypothetical protein